MSAKRTRKIDPRPRQRRTAKVPWFRQNWLDILVLGTWSLTFFRYWITGKLFLLLHPDYMWLANGA
ncbi:MAG: TIGR03943 family protein, partial [Cyanobacteria bacterium P01_H01_bin.105]